MANDVSGGISPIAVAHCLMGLSFPAGRDQLVQQARKRNANREVIELLQRLPNRRYDRMADIERAVIQMEE
jgi:ribose 1,5-bisphosphokinase PhnN